MSMRIWHQSFTVLDDLPAYEAAMKAHIAKIVRPDTEVVMHGLVPASYTSNYPGTDIAHEALYTIHGMQWMAKAMNAQKGGFDAFAMCTIPNPLIRQIRTIIDIPVVGYGESSFHLACMLGRRFGVMFFIDRMIPLYRGHLEAYGLTSRCAAMEAAGFTFQDVLPAFKDPGPLLDRFRTSARALIAKGADVIVPGEMPLNVLLATNGVSSIDGVPIVDGLAVTLKMAELFVDLRRTTGMMQSRSGFTGAAPPPGRVQELMTFYGLDKLLDK